MAEQNVAAFRVTLDGQDLGAELAQPGEDITDKVGPRLLRLQVSEKRGGEADQLDITIHDHDGKMALPKKGAVLSCTLGWRGGADVAAGLVDKGSFKVDEVEYSGPPDIIVIRARSADFSSSYRVRRERRHLDTTLGAIVRKVAADNGLKAQISAELASIPVAVLGQDQKSDMALVRELGRRYDAVATVKKGKLIFSRIGSGTTATGQAIPAGTLTRRDGDTFSYRRVERGQYDGVEARYHDQDKAKRETVRAGAGGASSAAGRKPKRLRRTFANKADAEAAASAEHGRIQRAAAEFDYTLALGRPDLYPERSLRVSGFKPEIDGQRWLIAEATHSLDENGLSTRLKLETA